MSNTGAKREAGQKEGEKQRETSSWELYKRKSYSDGIPSKEMEKSQQLNLN